MNKKSAYILFSSYFFLCLSFVPAQSGTLPVTISMWNRGVFNLYEGPGGTTSVGPDWMGYTDPQGAYNSLSMYYAIQNVSWNMTAEWEGDWSKLDISNTVLDEFSGSYSLFNGIARITAGKVRADGGYRFTNFDSAGFSTRIANSETGVLLTVQPAQGVSFGTFLPVPVSSQAASTTYTHMNFGASWNIPKVAILKASYRMEPYTLYSTTLKGKELAIGGQLTAVQNFLFTLGYRWFDTAQEHDIFMDTSYRFPSTLLSAYAYMSVQASLLYKGFKLNIEQNLGKTALVAGSSVSWGEDSSLWWLDGWDFNPYLRYDFGGSSVQIGVDGTYTSSFAYKIQLSYTIGF